MEGYIDTQIRGSMDGHAYLMDAQTDTQIDRWTDRK